jgi:hypothetical protein
VLARVLANSTALYATLAPLSAIAVTGYLATRQARFLVTGDTARGAGPAGPIPLRRRVRRMLADTHPDSPAVRALEVACGVVLLAAAVASLQIALIGLAVGYMTIALMHTRGWRETAGVRFASWVPAAAIAFGFAVGGIGLVGAQAVLMGYGFHF